MAFLNLDFGLKSGFLAFLIVAISLIILISLLEEHEGPEKNTVLSTKATTTTIKTTTIPSFCQIKYNILNDTSRNSSYNVGMNDDYCDDSSDPEKSPDWKGTGMM